MIKTLMDSYTWPDEPPVQEPDEFECSGCGEIGEDQCVCSDLDDVQRADLEADREYDNLREEGLL